MTSLRDVEGGFRALTLGERRGDDDAPVWPGVPVERQRLYRGLVRNNLKGVLRRSCPHARRIAGDAAFDAVTDAFLAEHLIQTRLTRDIPGEFTGWLLARTGLPLPDHIEAAAFAELCHFEALEIEITMAETTPHIPGPLVDDAGIVMDGSARLAIYRHPVQLVRSSTTTLPAPTTTPTVLLCFQRAEALAVERIAPAVGKVLMHAAAGATVGAAINAVVAEGQATSVTVDVGRVRSALVGLHRLGAIAGFVKG